jgi:hypothetical protein
MRLLIFFSLLFLSGPLRAQVPAKLWDRRFGGDRAEAVVQTSDGSYVLCGNTRLDDGDLPRKYKTSDNNNIPPADIWILKLTANGSRSWATLLGGSSEDQVSSIRQTSDGGYIVCGYTRSSDGDITAKRFGGSWDVWVVKLNADGTKNWDRTYGGGGFDVAYSIAQTTDGGYVLCGYTDSPLSRYGNAGDVTGSFRGVWDIWVLKLTANGTKSWDRTFGFEGSDKAYSIMQTSDGGYVLCGERDSPEAGDAGGGKGRADVWVAKLTVTGTTSWERILGGRQEDKANSITQTTDGGYILCGTTSSSDGDETGGSKGGYDAWVVKLTANGTKSWDRTFGGNEYDKANSIVQTTDGGYVLCGDTYSADGDVTGGNKGERDAWIVKLTATGAKSWDRTYGGLLTEEANSIVQTSDGGYVFAGFTSSTGGDVSGGDGYTWVVRLGGSALTTCTHTAQINVPGGTSLCAGTSATLSASVTGGTGPFTYQWRSAAGNLAATSSLTASQAGTYSVTVTNAQGCSQSATVTLTQKPRPVATISPAGPLQLSAGGSFVLSVSAVAGQTYQWSRNGQPIVGATASQYTALQTGAYTVSVNRDGCQAISSPTFIQSTPVSAASVVLRWEKTFGGSDWDDAFWMAKTADGGYIVCGSTSSMDGDITQRTGTSTDIWILKLNANGTVGWDRRFGGSGTELGWSVAQTTDGGYIVCGTTNSTDGDVTGGSKGGLDAWVIKLTANGTKSWDRTFGGSGDDGTYSIVQTTDGGYVLCGSTRSSNGDVTGGNKGGLDVWVIKLTANGTKSWDRTFGGSGVEGAESIVQTLDGGYALAGYTSSSNGDVTGGIKGERDIWVLRAYPKIEKA